MLNPDYKEMSSLLLDSEVEFLLVGAYALAAHGLIMQTAFCISFKWPRFCWQSTIAKNR